MGVKSISRRVLIKVVISIHDGIQVDLASLSRQRRFLKEYSRHGLISMMKTYRELLVLDGQS